MFGDNISYFLYLFFKYKSTAKKILKFFIKNIFLSVLYNMNDTYDLLKNELRVYYPDVTDDELNEMTDKLIEAFTIGAKAIYEMEKSQINNSAVA